MKRLEIVRYIMIAVNSPYNEHQPLIYHQGLALLFTDGLLVFLRCGKGWVRRGRRGRRLT